MSSYNPAPGKQDPGKYHGQVGQNYLRYGEQPGRIYYPPTDTYYMDPKYAKQYGQEQGYIDPDPKKPSLTDSLLPIAGVLGAAEIGKAGGKAIPDFLSKGWGMFGSGAKATPEVSQLASSSAAADGTPYYLASNVPEAQAPFDILGSSDAAAAPEAAAGGIGFLPAAGIGAGLFLGGKAAYDEFKGKKPGLLGRGTLDIATGGLNELALASGLLGHKSTRQRESENTNNLLAQAPDNQKWQDYVSGIRAQYNAPPPDPSKPFFGGKYGSFDEYQKAGLNAPDLANVEGNLSTYGPDWAGLTPEQQAAVTQKNIDSGLYYSKDGEVKISDPAKALENKNAVLGSAPPPVPTAPTQATTQKAGGLIGARPL